MTVAGAVLVFRFAVSHPEPVVNITLAVSPESVPPPPFVMVMSCVGGDETEAVKVNALGDATIDGCELIVSVTGTGSGALPATGDRMFTVAL
mgnify:CR=1 FL=1